MAPKILIKVNLSEVNQPRLVRELVIVNFFCARSRQSWL